ncbi:RTA1 domain protein [Planoprotostelium fungivorum]|uniref:RTA1 domain protein n=1 Tax=Planoprotostelium fungivorum TaxID=1890364 RepID=A0A2P6MNB8_9EUKA|nr:RTA1 domain protein [Planoprotostelium fungivorum]
MNTTSVLDLQKGSAYNYIPHAWIGILFITLFAISTLAHLVQVSYYRGWWLHVLTIGGIGECIGWGARLYNAYEPTNGDGFLCQIAVLVIAPVFYSAAIYLILGKVMSLTHPEYSRLRPKLYSIVFITCDVIALVVQAIGGGMAATADDHEGADLGARIMLGGIVFQLVSMTLFVIFAADFAIKLLAAMKTGACDLSSQQKSDLKRIAVPVIISSVALYVRGVYRVIELSEGWNGPIISTESYFVVLDGLMMVIAQGVFNIVHPAKTLKELAGHKTEVTKLQTFAKPNSAEYPVSECILLTSGWSCGRKAKLNQHPMTDWHGRSSNAIVFKGANYHSTTLPTAPRKINSSLKDGSQFQKRMAFILQTTVLQPGPYTGAQFEQIWSCVHLLLSKTSEEEITLKPSHGLLDILLILLARSWANVRSRLMEGYSFEGLLEELFPLQSIRPGEGDMKYLDSINISCPLFHCILGILRNLTCVQANDEYFNNHTVFISAMIELIKCAEVQVRSLAFDIFVNLSASIKLSKLKRQHATELLSYSFGALYSETNYTMHSAVKLLSRLSMEDSNEGLLSKLDKQIFKRLNEILALQIAWGNMDHQTTDTIHHIVIFFEFSIKSEEMRKTVSEDRDTLRYLIHVILMDIPSEEPIKNKMMKSMDRAVSVLLSLQAASIRAYECIGIHRYNIVQKAEVYTKEKTTQHLSNSMFLLAQT